MRKLKLAIFIAFLLFIIPLQLGSWGDRIGVAEGNDRGSNSKERTQILSPIWNPLIRQWSLFIQKEAHAHGLDPDFIAAVVNAESNGDEGAVSYAGAVGLMGVMPTGPGLEWRPPPETLIDPEINLSWGVAILAKILQQSGGDISAALAAYSGGWGQANSRVPQEYASQVLNNYGRAVAARSDISPDIASKWTIATEIPRGHIPVDPLILSQEPLSGLRKYGEHVVYNYVDESGRAFYVKGFAVPLALVVPLETTPSPTSSDTVDAKLMARLGMSETKISDSNPRVLLACLPSLSRLRGQLSTRWFAPSGCPSWHR